LAQTLFTFCAATITLFRWHGADRSLVHRMYENKMCRLHCIVGILHHSDYFNPLSVVIPVTILQRSDRIGITSQAEEWDSVGVRASLCVVYVYSVRLCCESCSLFVCQHYHDALHGIVIV
jgi:hypothetical protein